MGTPQARWREITQSGLASTMPRSRFCPEAGTNSVSAMAFSATSRKVWRCRLTRRPQRLVHGDEPLRRVAEDHRLLGAPGVRILVLEPAARDQHAGVDQRLDDGLVGVALVALVVDDALALEARRILGEAPVAVDGEGDGGVDAARLQLRRVLHPDVEVLAAVAGRGVHEAGAVLVGDVVAGEQRHLEIVAHARASGCAQSRARESVGGDGAASLRTSRPLPTS